MNIEQLVDYPTNFGLMALNNLAFLWIFFCFLFEETFFFIMLFFIILLFFLVKLNLFGGARNFIWQNFIWRTSYGKFVYFPGFLLATPMAFFFILQNLIFLGCKTFLFLAMRTSFGETSFLANFIWWNFIWQTSFG